MTLPAVCLLVTDYDGQGGLQMQSRRLTERLAGAGGRVLICTRNYQHRAAEETIGSRTIRRTRVVAPPDPRAATGHPPLLSLAPFNSLLFLLQGFFWCYRRRASYDVIHCQQMSGALVLGALLKFFTHKPLLVRVTSTGALGDVTRLHELPFAKIRLRLTRMVDRWVALTKAMAGELDVLNVAPEKIAIIPNASLIPENSASDELRARARAALGITAPKLVIYVGRLSAEKGLDTLFRAWPGVLRQHPRAVLYLLGEGGSFGAARDALKDLAEELHMTDSVRFQGHVDDVLQYLYAADLFVLPTPAEGMSNALVEAMGAGTPVVTTDIPPHEQLVVDGESALLVPPNDPPALAGAIARALSDDELRRRIGRGAREKAIRDLSLEAMTNAYLVQYRSLMVRSGIHSPREETHS